MLSKLIALLGLYMPAPTIDPDAEKAIRRANAASDQHGRITDRARAAALDTFYQQEMDSRPDEMIERTKVLRETLVAVAQRAGRSETR